MISLLPENTIFGGWIVLSVLINIIPYLLNIQKGHSKHGGNANVMVGG